MSSLCKVIRLAAVSGAWRGSGKSLSTSVSRETGAGGKIYEFRTYAVHPAKMRECMCALEEVLPVRTGFSKLNGYWYTELGGLNEINFLWEFGGCPIKYALINGKGG